eukprot:jgi/Botrbrau1/17366/Bobra.0015s0106.1
MSDRHNRQNREWRSPYPRNERERPFSKRDVNASSHADRDLFPAQHGQMPFASQGSRFDLAAQNRHGRDRPLPGPPHPLPTTPTASSMWRAHEAPRRSSPHRGSPQRIAHGGSTSGPLDRRYSGLAHDRITGRSQDSYVPRTASWEGPPRNHLDPSQSHMDRDVRRGHLPPPPPPPLVPPHQLMRTIASSTPLPPPPPLPPNSRGLARWPPGGGLMPADFESGEFRNESSVNSFSGGLPHPPSLGGPPHLPHTSSLGFTDDRTARRTLPGPPPVGPHTSLPPHLAQMDAAPMTDKASSSWTPKLELRGPERVWGIGNRAVEEVTSLVDPADVKLEPRRPVDAELLQQRLQAVQAVRSDPPLRSDSSFEIKSEALGRGEGGAITPPLSGTDGTPGDLPMPTVGSGGLEGHSDEAPRRKKQRLKWGEGLNARNKAAKAPEAEVRSQGEAVVPQDDMCSPSVPKIEAGDAHSQEAPAVADTTLPAKSVPAPERDSIAAAKDLLKGPSSPAEVSALIPLASRMGSADAAARTPPPGPVAEEMPSTGEAGPVPAADGDGLAIGGPPGLGSPVEVLTDKLLGLDKEIGDREKELEELEAAKLTAVRAAEAARAERAEVEKDKIPDAEFPQLSDDELDEPALPDALPESSEEEPLEPEVRFDDSEEDMEVEEEEVTSEDEVQEEEEDEDEDEDEEEDEEVEDPAHSHLERKRSQGVPPGGESNTSVLPKLPQMAGGAQQANREEALEAELESVPEAIYNAVSTTNDKVEVDLDGTPAAEALPEPEAPETEEVVRDWVSEKKGRWALHLARASAVEGGKDMTSEDIDSEGDADILQWSPHRKQSLLTLDERFELCSERIALAAGEVVKAMNGQLLSCLPDYLQPEPGTSWWPKALCLNHTQMPEYRNTMLTGWLNRASFKRIIMERKWLTQLRWRELAEEYRAKFEDWQVYFAEMGLDQLQAPVQDPILALTRRGAGSNSTRNAQRTSTRSNLAMGGPPRQDLEQLAAKERQCLDQLKNMCQMPDQLVEEDDRRFQGFENNNLRVEDPVQQLKDEEDAKRPWSADEKRIFMDKFLAFPKDFRKIASYLPHRTTGDCVAFYYKVQKLDDFAAVRRKQQLKKRRQQSEINRSTTYMGMGPAARMPDATTTRALPSRPTPQPYADGRPIAKTRGTRSKPAGRSQRYAPVLEPSPGIEAVEAHVAEPPPSEVAVEESNLPWTPAEEARLVEGVKKYGRNLDLVREFMGSNRSKASIKDFYTRSRKRLKLDQLVRARGHPGGPVGELEELAPTPIGGAPEPARPASPEDAGLNLHTTERLPEPSPEHEEGELGEDAAPRGKFRTLEDNAAVSQAVDLSARQGSGAVRQLLSLPALTSGPPMFPAMAQHMLSLLFAHQAQQTAQAQAHAQQQANAQNAMFAQLLMNSQLPPHPFLNFAQSTTGIDMLKLQTGFPHHLGIQHLLTPPLTPFHPQTFSGVHQGLSHMFPGQQFVPPGATHPFFNPQQAAALFRQAAAFRGCWACACPGSEADNLEDLQSARGSDQWEGVEGLPKGDPVDGGSESLENAPTRKQQAVWTHQEKEAYQAWKKSGKDFSALERALPNKTTQQIKNFQQNSRKQALNAAGETSRKRQRPDPASRGASSLQTPNSTPSATPAPTPPPEPPLAADLPPRASSGGPSPPQSSVGTPGYNQAQMLLLEGIRKRSQGDPSELGTERPAGDPIGGLGDRLGPSEQDRDMSAWLTAMKEGGIGRPAAAVSPLVGLAGALTASASASRRESSFLETTNPEPSLASRLDQLSRAMAPLDVGARPLGTFDTEASAFGEDGSGSAKDRASMLDDGSPLSKKAKRVHVGPAIPLSPNPQGLASISSGGGKRDTAGPSTPSGPTITTGGGLAHASSAPSPAQCMDTLKQLRTLAELTRVDDMPEAPPIFPDPFTTPDLPPKGLKESHVQLLRNLAMARGASQSLAAEPDATPARALPHSWLSSISVSRATGGLSVPLAYGNAVPLGPQTLSALLPSSGLDPLPAPRIAPLMDSSPGGAVPLSALQQEPPATLPSAGDTSGLWGGGQPLRDKFPAVRQPAEEPTLVEKLELLTKRPVKLPELRCTESVPPRTSPEADVVQRNVPQSLPSGAQHRSAQRQPSPSPHPLPMGTPRQAATEAGEEETPEHPERKAHAAFFPRRPSPEHPENPGTTFAHRPQSPGYPGDSPSGQGTVAGEELADTYLGGPSKKESLGSVLQRTPGSKYGTPGEASRQEAVDMDIDTEAPSEVLPDALDQTSLQSQEIPDQGDLAGLGSPSMGPHHDENLGLPGKAPPGQARSTLTPLPGREEDQVEDLPHTSPPAEANMDSEDTPMEQQKIVEEGFPHS